MKFFLKFRLFAALSVALMLAGTKAEAQGFGSFCHAIGQFAFGKQFCDLHHHRDQPVFGDLSDVTVSNTLPASVQFVDANPSFGGGFTNFGNVTMFDIGEFDGNTIVQMTLTVLPTAAGLHHQHGRRVCRPNVTNTAATNVVTQVTNAVIRSRSRRGNHCSPDGRHHQRFDVLWRERDQRGPNAAPSVMLTNTLPPGVILKSVSPTNPVTRSSAAT